ncbi:hypothetical protein [Lacinutrix jangbogonensis]|uniref:hypothetical protein n=1 Tax=Lacinutrix jangbogonensis TaxID=1469557 RepID=UPI00053DA6CD|nr:hypothetical protein [Lacinutrix jangbogonensis]
MKKKLLTMLLIFCFCKGFSQEISKGGNFYINASRNWNEISTLKEGVTKNDAVINTLKGANYKLKVSAINDSIVYFKFLYFNKNDTLRAALNGINKDKIFNMPISDFESMTDVYYNRVDWRIGVFTVPFKIRLDDFAFTANVNMGSSISAKIRTDRKEANALMIEPLLSIGIAGVELNDENATITEDTPTSLFAFSFSGGVLVHITEEVNMGFFLGMDKLSNTDQSKVNWKHNGNLWMGIGFNVSFSNNKNNASTKNQG